jgi:hypothetical protein
MTLPLAANRSPGAASKWKEDKEAKVSSALRFRFFLLGLLGVLRLTIAGRGQTRDYHSELAAARQEETETDTII